MLNSEGNFSGSIQETADTLYFLSLILRKRGMEACWCMKSRSKINLIGKCIWTASSEFVTYRLCEQRRFRRACASVQSRQNLRCSLIEAVTQEEPSDRKPDPWPLWIAGHAQLKFVMTECSKTQIRLTGPIWCFSMGPSLYRFYGFDNENLPTMSAWAYVYMAFTARISSSQ